MNYYPNNNFYQGYSNYNNTYQPAATTINTLQGKIVDSIDMVRANEVPFGGFGIFPKGDLSEIYIKSWNSNGTTQINTYKPVPNEESIEVKESNLRNELLEKINDLNKRLDVIISGNGAKAEQTSVSATQPTAAKDVRVNAF